VENEQSFSKLPEVGENEIFRIGELGAQQHFTEPPMRYTEGSLIKFLEENGIGRPSTFTTIITTIIDRGYVKREAKSLVPTPLGEVITKLMIDKFPNVVNYEFTAQMEDRLDSIEHGGTTTQALLGEFYRDFNETLEIAMGNVEKQKIEVPVEESDVICDKCGSRMIYKSGRYGKFLACPNYPACKNTLAVDKQGHVVEKAPAAQPEKAGFTCELCGAEMVIRTGKFGEFYACSNYPSCRFTKQKIQYVGVDCPKCKAGIVVRHSRDKKVFYSCERYPDCDYSSWDMPIPESCPDCGHLLVYKKTRKTVVCSNADCRFQEEREVQVIE
jgi:DNA topoisomerase-1